MLGQMKSKRSQREPAGAVGQMPLRFLEIDVGLCHAFRRITARVTDPFESAEADQVDIGRQEPFFGGLITEQVGTQILLVVVGQYGDYDRVSTPLFKDLKRSEEIGS